MSFVIEPPVFADREDAGRQLVHDRLGQLQPGSWIVVAISRDALPVAAVVADALATPLDLQIVEPLSAPQAPEHHFGAVALDGTLVDNESIRARLGLDERQVALIRDRARLSAAQHDAAVHRGRPRLATQNRDVLLVDDGTSAGFALLAGVQSIRRQGSRRLVVALPVAAAATIEQIGPFVDDVVALIIRESPHFAPVGYYRRWSPIDDDTAAAILRGR